MASAEPLAVVTGANRGLGLETCRQLAERGYRVVLTARDVSKAQRAAESLSANVLPRQLDVTSARSVADFARSVADELGGIAALVNNAGISLRGFDASVVEGTLAVNFYGALRVTQALLPLVSEGGNVVMVSSGMGELSAFGAKLRGRFLNEQAGLPQLLDLVAEFESEVASGRHAEHGWPSSAYRVSKAALNALTRILAREQQRVRVNAVCPGWVRTDMGGPAASRDVKAGARGIVWAATLGASGPNGGFFRDAKPIEW